MALALATAPELPLGAGSIGQSDRVTESAEWTDVGVLEVESGTCLIVDPTFHRDGFYGVEQVERAVLEALASPTKAAGLALPDGHVIGTVVLPGLGDDAYPVEVRYWIILRGDAESLSCESSSWKTPNCRSGASAWAVGALTDCASVRPSHRSAP